MYYSNGNYEAFARPRKPQGVDEKSAYIVGSGLAGLAAAGVLAALAFGVVQVYTRVSRSAIAPDVVGLSVGDAPTLARREGPAARASTDYTGWLQAFCARKFNSDFSQEMSRSAAGYLADFAPEGEGRHG